MLENPINTTVKSFEINDNEENILFDDKFSEKKIALFIELIISKTFEQII